MTKFGQKQFGSLFGPPCILCTTTARTWNDLPFTSTCVPSLTTFKKNLKTHFFKQTYNFLTFSPDVACFHHTLYCVLKALCLWLIESDDFNNNKKFCNCV